MIERAVEAITNLGAVGVGLGVVLGITLAILLVVINR